MTTINDSTRLTWGAIRRTTTEESGISGLVSLKVVKVLPAVLLVILLITTVMPAGVSATSALAASSITVTASSDAQVRESDPDTNFGTSTYLQVDGDSGARSESYLLFNVSGLSGAVSNAVVRVYASTNGSTNGPALVGTETSWTETGLTWNNRPAQTTSELGNIGDIGTDVWVEYNVTSQVAGDGTYSFALVADSNDGLTFASREGGQAAELVITTGSSGSTPTVVASTPTAAPTSPVEPDASTSYVLVGAGDISSCGNNNDEATAKLLDGISGTVFTTGDNVYTSGTSTEYRNCYDPTWGRHKSRTKPVPGNHDYRTSGASGYFNYFNNPSSYYAYNLGSWRIYALNSEIGATATSAQVTWLKNDLAANPRQCVLAYWHKPRWSSGGEHGNDSSMQTLWKTLYDARAELVINGHDHDYERFTQMNASGSAVSSGLREIVVGTGGASHYSFGSPLSTSQVRNSTTYGVLKLTLNSTSYSWKFVPVAGKTFTDTGTTSCR